MQISDSSESTNNRVDISASMEIKQNCEGQTYFEFFRDEYSNITTNTGENKDE